MNKELRDRIIDDVCKTLDGASDVPNFADVFWSYRLFLLRNPEFEDSSSYSRRTPSDLRDLSQSFLGSQEFLGIWNGKQKPAPRRAPAARPPTAANTKIEVASLQEFSGILKRIEEDSANDAELRTNLDKYVLRAPKPASTDPFTTEYRDGVAQTFAELRGAAYERIYEGLDIDLQNELRWGTPYGTKTSSIIGPFLIAYGHLIYSMALPPEASILELGCGHGGLTYHLSRSGYRVTAVDINASSVNLVRVMTQGIGNPPTVIQADIDSLILDTRFDAIVFFESFHHFLDHAALLNRCKGWLAPGGMIVFAAEPIVPRGDPAIPYPWGLRLVGESLRAIYKWGWLELGFLEEYFFELLSRSGLVWTRRRNPDSHWSDVIIARPIR